MDVRRLAEKGHSVTMIGEQQFWKLVEPRSKARKKATSKAKRGQRGGRQAQRQV